MQKNGDAVKFALFEADGGAWKLTAAKSIAEFIAEELVVPIEVFA